MHKNTIHSLAVAGLLTSSSLFAQDPPQQTAPMAIPTTPTQTQEAPPPQQVESPKEENL